MNEWTRESEDFNLFYIFSFGASFLSRILSMLSQAQVLQVNPFLLSDAYTRIRC